MDQRRATAFIFCTVTLDLLALGLMIPVLPQIVLGFMGGDTAGAAQVLGLFSTVWALMQFFFSPLLGVISDRYGRRPVILLLLRPRARPRVHGGRALPHLAIHRPGHLRHHLGHHRHGLCLYRRRSRRPRIAPAPSA